MSATKIEWTEETWNPITGCTKCSDGCKNCYAEKFAKRLRSMGNRRYVNGFDITVHRDLFELPLKWNKERMVFVNSMSDLFHEEIAEKDILALFKVMNQAKKHTFQILTKRIERVLEMSNKIRWTNNIWMGVSIENKDSIYRCELLKKTGAAIKFISAEPLLESLAGLCLENIDWLIVGGESGVGARKIQEDWVIELRDMALTNDVAFFFKQWGGVQKKKNGNLLQGKRYMEFPECL